MAQCDLIMLFFVNHGICDVSCTASKEPHKWQPSPSEHLMAYVGLISWEKSLIANYFAFNSLLSSSPPPELICRLANAIGFFWHIVISLRRLQPVSWTTDLNAGSSHGVDLPKSVMIISVESLQGLWSRNLGYSTVRKFGVLVNWGLEQKDDR